MIIVCAWLMWSAIVVLLVVLCVCWKDVPKVQDIDAAQDYMEFYADLHAMYPECRFTDSEAVKLYDVSRYCKREHEGEKV